MVEPSKKRKGSSSTTTAAGQYCHYTSSDPPTPPSPSFSSPRSLTLFSSNDQRQRYYSLFSNRVILDPKYLNLEFFDGETFDCYQVFQNSELLDFTSLKLSFYPELVWVFYNNLKIQDDVIFLGASNTHCCLSISILFFDKTEQSGCSFWGHSSWWLEACLF